MAALTQQTILLRDVMSVVAQKCLFLLPEKHIQFGSLVIDSSRPFVFVLLFTISDQKQL